MDWKQIINIQDPDFIEWHREVGDLMLKVWYSAGGYYRGSITSKNADRRSFSLADSNTIEEAMKAAMRLINEKE